MTTTTTRSTRAKDKTIKISMDVSYHGLDLEQIDIKSGHFLVTGIQRSEFNFNACDSLTNLKQINDAIHPDFLPGSVSIQSSSAGQYGYGTQVAFKGIVVVPDEIVREIIERNKEYEKSARELKRREKEVQKLSDQLDKEKSAHYRNRLKFS